MPVDHASLRHAIEHAAHLLPAQGPITAFVHHNTLHAFEDLPFEQGVLKGSQIFGCHPYLPEDRFREYLDQERILVSDLHSVLAEHLGEQADEKILGMVSRIQLRLAMLEFPMKNGPDAELRWLVAATDALAKFRADVPVTIRQRVVDLTKHWVMRDLRNGKNGSGSANGGSAKGREMLAKVFQSFDEAKIESWENDTWEAFSLHALWHVCYHGAHVAKHREDHHPQHTRHRDLLLHITGQDSDQLVNVFLIPFCGAFLDQGFAHWPLPLREQGFFAAFLNVYSSGGPPDAWLKKLPAELRRWQTEKLTPLDTIQESLDLLGVSANEQEHFISDTLLSLRGWAGMLWQLETRSDRALLPAPTGSLENFLAIRLLLDRLALEHLAKTALDYTGPLCELRTMLRKRAPAEATGKLQRAFLIFQLAQLLGWLPAELLRLSAEDWTTLMGEVESFNGLARRRFFQEAYERNYYQKALNALSVHAQPKPARKDKPRFQLVCCIDDREESYRRHLEETCPAVETFGAAGFYAVVMYYRGAADADFTPLCPVVVRPKHYVVEDSVFSLEKSHQRRAKTRSYLGTATHHVHTGSRSFAAGALLSTLFGPLASIPLVGRILFPRLASRIRRTFGSFVSPPPITQLQLERTAEPPSAEVGHLGYTVAEMATIVERQLRDIGLIADFSRLIIFTGHGSSSLNNPHESAYNCGACAGGRGGPNARAFAQMANDPRVRELLAQRGLPLPSDSVFVGAYHNTCDDSVIFFDLDRLPTTHKDDFAFARAAIDETRQRNAHERCRRFASAPLTISQEAALRHVEGRAEDLAQTRPEYNHATNALHIVGRRTRTRGLFLDRRSFLTS